MNWFLVSIISLISLLVISSVVAMIGYRLWRDQRRAKDDVVRLATVVEQAQEIIQITDLNGHIVYVNPYFESVTGYSAQEAMGKNPNLLNSGKQDRYFYKNLWETIKAGKTWQGNLINRRKDGRLYHEAATIFPIKNGSGDIINFAAVKRDITAQVEFEQAIRESEKRYRLLADNATDVIWTTDLQGKITYVSPSIQALLGYTAEEIELQSQQDMLDRYFPEAVYKDFKNLIASIQAHPEQTITASSQKEGESRFIEKLPMTTIEWEQTHKNGSKIWAESNISLLYDDNKQGIGLLGVTRDITARKKAEEEQGAYTRQQELLNQITQAAIAEMDFSAMLQILADRLGELLDADGCYITLWDEEKQIVIPAAAYGPLRETYPQPQGHTAADGLNFTTHIYKTCQTLVVPDVFASPYIAREIAERYPSRSILGLPLVANQRFLGAALISFHDYHIFTNEEIERSEQATQQIALAVLKAQLLVEAERRATEAETLRMAGAAVASTLRQQEAIQRVLKELKRVVPYDSACVMLLQEGSMQIVGENGFEQPEIVLGTRFMLDEGTPNSVVFQTRQPYLIEDAPTQYEEFQKPPANKIRGWLGVPVIASDEMIGMITLDSHRPGAFTKDHARLASAFADQVAIALENSRLFEETQRLAVTDSLTGLFNRRHFMDVAQQEYERALRYQKPLSLIMLDIDYFKKINDTYGHLAGDLALQVLAKVCQKQLRASDTIGRYGGEELIVLLPETDSEIAAAVAERLRQQVSAETIQSEHGNFSITISLGIAASDGTCKNIDELIDHADQALYRSKNGGRNRISIWPLNE